MESINFEGQQVLVRVDFNVPLNDENQVSDDTRLKAAIPTIQHIHHQGATILLMSHLGRPQKKKNEDGTIDKQKFSLAPVAPYLSDLLDVPISFIPYTAGQLLKDAVQNLEPGSIALIENTRFEAGEEKGDPALAQEWAELADIFINDAFGTAHRNHASNAGVASYFSGERKSFGFLMQKELEAAERILNNPARPLTAILGGAKVSDKIGLIDNLLDKADYIIVGGGMAYTFMKALGGTIGNSLCEENKLDLARSLVEKAAAQNVKIVLPEDSKIADSFSETAHTQLSPSNEIPNGWMGLDIGNTAMQDFGEIILKSKTICWNGPMGVFELAPFAHGTKKIAEQVAQATKNGAFTLVGGGDSVAAVNQMGLANQVSYVSTGGGAMLTLLEGGEMPGIDSIKTGRL